MNIWTVVRIGLTLCLMTLTTAPAFTSPRAMALDDYPLQASAPEVSGAVEFLLGQQSGSGDIAGMTVSSQAVAALAVAGQRDAVEGLMQYLESQSTARSFEAIDLAQMILAIVAGGDEPRAFSGRDFVAELLDLHQLEEITGYEYSQIGAPNLVDDDIWAILALEAAGEDVDKEIVYFVQELQNDDGGWGQKAKGDSEVDVTAAAIMALKAAGLSSGSESIENALDFLADAQHSDGGFGLTLSKETDAKSDALAIMAILAADGDPNGSAWRRSEGGLIDHLLALQQQGGYFAPPLSGDDNRSLMTCYAITALLGKPYPVKPPHNGGRNCMIARSPTRLTFHATEGGDNPEGQEFEIWNSGDGSMTWKVKTNADWLTVSPASGVCPGGQDRVLVSVDSGELGEGDYQSILTIISGYATNSPQTVMVDLEVGARTNSAERPQVSCSPRTLAFDIAGNTVSPASQSFSIWNSGGGRLDWRASSDAGWFSLNPESGSSNGAKEKVTVSVNTAGLSGSGSSGRITVQDRHDSGNRQTIKVTLDADGSVSAADDVEDEEYILSLIVTPDGAGAITRSVNPGPSGYSAGTSVTLTAVASDGYAFSGWSGDAGGSAPSTTIIMNNHRSVVARFLKFDAGGMTDVKLGYVPPELVSLEMMPYPVESIPSDPPGFVVNRAVLVRPQGSGTFALDFSDIQNADYVGIFQVVNGAWVQIPRTVVGDTTLQVSLPVAETVLVFATPGNAPNKAWKKISGLFDSVDSAIVGIIAVIGLLVLAIVALLIIIVRRDSY